MAPSDLDVSQTHPYTCNSCSVAFRNGEAQRAHMRSDWHRYNLKRRIAELPPTSAEDYKEKVLAAQANTTDAAAKASFETTCTTCNKTYFSQNAYQNHIGSQKHKLRVAAGRKGSVNETESMISSTYSTGAPLPSEASGGHDLKPAAELQQVVDRMQETSLQERDARRGRTVTPHAATSAEKGAIDESSQPPLSRCLFCNYDSPTWKLSISHMTKIHGLFIPERSYLTNIEGLLEYLQAKIRENHECLCCHKLKGTTSGVQTHMRDKGHCRIAFETEEEMIEVGQFYDFSSTYSDPEPEEVDTDMDEPAVKSSGGVRLPGEKPEDEEWETDSSFSSLDSAELCSVPNDDRTDQYQRLPLNRHHSQTDPRPHRVADGFHSHAHNHANAVFYDEHEMHLPSGRVAGHRSLRKYYRQNLHAYLTPAERVDRAHLLDNGDDDDEEMEDVDSPATRSRALTRRGEMGMIGATDQQRKDVQAQEMRSRQKEQRRENRYKAKVEKQNNSQKHFRDPLLQ